MLNISDNHLSSKAYPKGLATMGKTKLPAWHWSFRRLLAVLIGLFLVFMFLPWTQNVRADGRVTTLRPEQRPQTVHATISGRIERWYVGEGQANFRHNPSHSTFCATHAAISINRSREEIFKVAKAQGWRAVELPRGGFNVIEFWIENRVMIELLTPDMAEDSVSMTKPLRKSA